ncbi:MAG TPA: hypothetical protein VGR61_06595, partial [Candidatus Dormibacteraeota bacterium]|nr:hypothetical protein [Candidatus Dormibacteraeota bacterium]
FFLRKHLFAMPLLRPVKGVVPAGVLMGALMFGTVFVLGHHVLTYVLVVVVGLLAYAGGLFALHAFSSDEIALVREAMQSRTKR